jgi:apolipoprotein N-acyltransferase
MPRLVLFAAAGALATLAAGRYSLAAAAWIAPVLLLRAARTGSVWAGLVPAALVHGVAFAAAWRGTFGIPFPAYVAIGMLFFAPYAVDRVLAPRLAGLVATLPFPAAWVAFEFALARIPLPNGRPLGTWGAVAYSLADVLPLVQLVAVTGIWGLAFLIAWCAAVVNHAWEGGGSNPRRHTDLVAAVIVVAAVTTWGGLRVAMAPRPAETVRIAAIAVDNPALTVGVWNPVARGRGVSPEDREPMRARLEPLHDALFEASAREARAGARVVVWAEDNAIVFADDEPALIERGQDLAREVGVHLFMGMVTLVPGQKAENKVVAVAPDGRVEFSYLKSFPTPWEASQPGDRILRHLDSTLGRISAAICYDFDHPAFIRAAGRAGVDIMLAPSDDGLQADPLHARMAAFRAVENGFSLVRPVIGGRALAVDPYGRVLAQADYGRDAYFAGGVHVLVAYVPTAGVSTLYTRMGDLLAWLSLGILMGLTLRVLAAAVDYAGSAGGTQRSDRLTPAIPAEKVRP